MQLGWLDVCLRVADVAVSRQFYEGLGFRRVEGDDAEGWAVVVLGEARIGLFTATYMATPFSLNFRGGDIGRIVGELGARGYRFDDSPTVHRDGSGSARLRDPDDNVLFFDSAPGESKLV